MINGKNVRHRQGRNRNKRANEIKRVIDDEKSRVGSPRIAKRLNDEGPHISRHTVAKIMKARGWRAKAARKYKATTNRNHHLAVAPNHLAQDFEATKPDQKWVSDMTSIWTDEGWLYLAVVLQLYSRKVIGWAMAERMTASLVRDALTMALWRRKLPKGVIVHTDRGSQYCSAAYQALLKQHQLLCSISKKGDCYDNAARESWNHSFTVEAIHGERSKSVPPRNNMSSRTSKCITIASGFIPHWAICPRPHVNRHSTEVPDILFLVRRISRFLNCTMTC